MCKKKDSEKWLERELCRKVAAIGGKALKYANGQEAGYPDRMVLLPPGIMVWAEIKSTGKKPRPIQQERIKELRDMGFLVAVIDTEDKLRRFIDILSRH